jgi:hypothetical protein
LFDASQPALFFVRFWTVAFLLSLSHSLTHSFSLENFTLYRKKTCDSLVRLKESNQLENNFTQNEKRKIRKEQEKVHRPIERLVCARKRAEEKCSERN